MNIYDRIREWAGRIERDEAPHPTHFNHRAARLVRRGLLPQIADGVVATGSTTIMRSLEASSDGDLRALNAAWRAQRAALDALSEHAATTA